MIICRWLEVSVWGFRGDFSQEDSQEESHQGVDFGISDSIALHSGLESLAHGLQSSPSAGSAALLDIVGGLFIIIIPALSQAKRTIHFRSVSLLAGLPVVSRLLLMRNKLLSLNFKIQIFIWTAFYFVYGFYQLDRIRSVLAVGCRGHSR